MYVDKIHDLITDPIRISPYRFDMQFENQESLNLESLAALLFNPPINYRIDFYTFLVMSWLARCRFPW